MIGAMYCRGCQYELAGNVKERCSECGRAFDPTIRRTFQRRPRRWQPLVGIGFSAVVSLAVLVGFWQSYGPAYGHSRFAALGTVAGIGLLGGIASGMLAASNRSWWGRVPLLFSGMLCIWTGLALGVDKYFRVWQSMPDAPDEAFSDAGAMVPVLIGWIPASMGVGVVFGVWLLVLWARHRPPRERGGRSG